MIKRLLLAGLLTVGASAAYAQQATTPPRAGDPQIAAMPSGADAKKLIGRNVKNAQDETVGEIESVYINADGKVDSVIWASAASWAWASAMCAWPGRTCASATTATRS